jgi:transposase InsO family protein
LNPPWVPERTVWKWRKRSDVQDRSHTPHKLQTTLTPPQEAVAVALRKALLVPLDDLLAVVREFLNPHVSRSGLDRCLRRHGVGNLQALKPSQPKPMHGTFKDYKLGYLHIDVKYLPQMADEDRRRYLFEAIDRATRWIFVRIYPAQTAANARRFLRDFERAAPMKITRVLTDNGKAFTDRLFGLRKRGATGQHEFDLLCAELGIEHRLALPMRPQTNGMVERFNGRIEDVLQSHRFRSGENLEQTLLRYVHLCNSQVPQSVLKGRTPVDAFKDWQRQTPELFRKRVHNHAGRDRYAPDFGNGAVRVKPFWPYDASRSTAGRLRDPCFVAVLRSCLRLRSPRVHASVRGRRDGRQHDAGSMQFRCAHLTSVLRVAGNSPDHGIIGTASLGEPRRPAVSRATGGGPVP